MENARTSVLFVHSSNEMYGADRILLQVIDTLPEADRTNAVVWLPDDVGPAENSLEDELSRRGIRFEIKSLPTIRRRYLSLRRAPALLKSLIQVRRDIARLKPRIVYLATSAALLSAIAARLSGVKLVVLHCQEIWGDREALLLGVLALPITHCVCISVATQRSLKGRLRNRAQVISNGTPDRSLPLVPLADRTGPLRFLVASRWTVRKGYVTLLEAWDTESPIGELTIVGSPPEVGQAVDVVRLVGDLSSSQSVRILGEVRDISPLIDESDFVLLPSDEPEGFGLVAIEAFARGRAVIGSDCGGLAEVVEPGLSGELFAPKDPLALRATLIGFARVDAARMGANARSVFVSRYSLDVFNSAFSEFWTEHLPIPTGSAHA